MMVVAQGMLSEVAPNAAVAAHLTRAAAVAGYVALFLAMALGLARVWLRACGRRGLLGALDAAHHACASVALALVALHLGALALDPALPFARGALLLPWGDAARPLGHALGALALYALVVVVVSSWARRWLPARTWRVLHGCAALLFLAATAHGLLAGADGSAPWMRALSLAGAVLAALVVGTRLATRRRGTRATPARRGASATDATPAILRR